MHHGAQNVVLIVFLILLLGAVLRYLLKNSGLPYTVALLLGGLIIGAVARGESEIHLFHRISEGAHALASVDPHLVLFLFLPPLLFESAFAMDVHIFRRSFGQIFLLAVPGLILGTVGIGLATKAIMPEIWSWSAVLMTGALLSATDPVAVVAILRELGAGKRLATLIEGESLLNDGTAIVIFSVFYGALAGGTAMSGGLISLEFVRVSLGGVLVGGLVAIAAIRWLGAIFNDALVEISITIVAAYLTYYLAESVLHVSGVLATVTLGVCFAGYGRTRISPEIEEFLSHFWEMMAYIANSLIFVLVGIVIALNVSLDEPRLWILLLVIYAVITVVRAAVNALLFPLLTRYGYGISKKESLVLTWGGLRGAVGLALALVVVQDSRIPAEIGEPLLFITAGIVVLTLMVNGTTIRQLVAYLGLDRMPKTRLALLASVAGDIEAETRRELTVLKGDPFLKETDWRHVRTHLPNLAEDLARIPVDDDSDRSMEVESMYQLLAIEKTSYWRQFKEGLLGRGAVRGLSEAVDEMVDGEADLTKREGFHVFWRIPRLAVWLERFPALIKHSFALSFERLAFGYDAAKAFAASQDELLIQAQQYVHSRRLEPEVLDEIKSARADATQAIDSLKTAFPEILTAIQTRVAARSLLNFQRRQIKKSHHQGLLNDHEAAHWNEAIERKMKSLESIRNAANPLDAEAMLREIPWLAEQPDGVVEQFEKAARERLYDVGQALVTQGEHGDTMYIIVRGHVHVEINTDDGALTVGKLGPGDVIGEMAILAEAPRTATVVADTQVAALEIRARDVEQLLASSKEIEQQIWFLAGVRFAENILSKKPPYDLWGLLRLRRYLLGGELNTYEEGDTFEVENESILIHGEVSQADTNLRGTGPSLLHPGKYTVHQTARLYISPGEVED